MAQLLVHTTGSGVSWRAAWSIWCIVLLSGLTCLVCTVHSQPDEVQETGVVGIADADYYITKYIIPEPGYNDSMLTHLSRRSANTRPGRATKTNSCQHIRDVPKKLRSSNNMKPSGLSSFYQKYTEAYGIPVLSSKSVSDDALRRACYATRFLFAGHSKVREFYYSLSGRVAVIGRKEGTNWIPEHSFLNDEWNKRARGLGATPDVPVSTGGEENLLCLREDRYKSQDIFLHEAAHGVQLLGAFLGIPGWDARLKAHYSDAKQAGLWANTYSMSSAEELFAEGTTAYFNVQAYSKKPNGVRGPINTREKLYKYDRTLYGLIEEVFPCPNTYLKRCESTRAKEDAQVLEMDCNTDDTDDTDGNTDDTDGNTDDTSGSDADCTDSNSNCVSWAKIGECKKNKEYMLKNCKKSCDSCSESATPAPRVAPDDGGCSNDDLKCGYWADNGECNRNPSFMLTNCKLSCGQCGNCKDKSPHCSFWQTNGYCTSNPTYMKINCQAACRLC